MMPGSDKSNGADMAAFYRDVLGDLLRDGTLTLESKLLVVCAGTFDRDVLMELGFRNVVLSNVDNQALQATPDAAFSWCHERADALSFPDDSFEWTLVHSGLHHLHVPQRGIAEMYRVASRGILAFEPYRSWFTRAGVALGFGQQYETAAVYHNDFAHGGVDDSPVPNYVYRFSTGEIRRTLQALAPVASPRIRFWYRTRIPGRLATLRQSRRAILVKLLEPILLWLGRNVPSFANNMAFAIAKPSLPEDLFPWLQMKDGAVVPDRDYLERIYKAST